MRAYKIALVYTPSNHENKAGVLRNLKSLWESMYRPDLNAKVTAQPFVTEIKNRGKIKHDLTITTTCGNVTCSKLFTQHLQCGNCRIITYCGKECQKIDWPRQKIKCVENNMLRNILVQFLLTIVTKK